jgi:hypothetical protein
MVRLKNLWVDLVSFDLLMYINHRSQQFTQQGLYNILEDVGFRNLEVIHTLGYYSVLSAVK